MSYERIPSSLPGPSIEVSDKSFVQSYENTEPRKSLRILKLRTLIIHTSIALLYISILTAVGFLWIKRQRSNQNAEKYLPAQEAIEYEIKTFDYEYWGNPFAGDPRPEHDEAWTKILQNVYIRLTKEELQKLNRTSIALKDGSGYVAEMGAYHELHCVKWIRKWIHRDHYWPALKGAMLEERKIHIDHCLELFRLNAMCHGSQAITTFEWFGSHPRPVSTHRQEECVNWGKLDAWSGERRVSLYDLDALADRPAPQDWELFDHDLRLGIKDGNVEGFTKVLENSDF